MEIKVRVGIALNHLSEIFYALQRVHNSQRIGQHESADSNIAKRVHNLINIDGRLLHSVAPILKIQVHGDAFLSGIFHLANYIFYVFLGRFLQLLSAVFQRAFGQQINGFTTTLHNPVDALSAVDKAQHLYPFKLVNLCGIAANHANRLFLALRNTSRRHFYAVNIQIVKQHTGNYQLLVGQKRNTAGLFAIAQRRVKNLHKGLNALIFVYLFACSHNSVFCLFCTRKSISSNPCIRQCFLYPFMSKCSLRPVALLVTV